MMAERGLKRDHSTIARWVLRSAGELHERIRSRMRKATDLRVEEADVRVQEGVLRPSAGFGRNRIDFFVSPHRNLIAAKSFLPPALWRADPCQPRVITVEGQPAYPIAMKELKRSGHLGQNCRHRPSPNLNNIVSAGLSKPIRADDLFSVVEQVLSIDLRNSKRSLILFNIELC